MFWQADCLLESRQDNIDEIQIEKMEEARAAYIAAVAAAKDNPTFDSLSAAADARSRLRAFVF